MADFKPYPTKVRIIEAHEGLTIETPRFPRAHPVKVAYASESLMSFEGHTTILLPIKVEDHVQPGWVSLKIMLEYQACAANYCLFPKKIKLDEKISVVARDQSVSKINEDIFAKFDPDATTEPSRGINFDLFGWKFSIDVSSGLGWILLLATAAFGGMLLNFTPCVLPLIPIKIISLSMQRQTIKDAWHWDFRCFWECWFFGSP